MIEIKNQSCIDYLKTIDSNSIDLILIDPPYLISRKTNFQNVKDKTTNMSKKYNISMEFGEWDNTFSLIQETLKECYRVLKKSGTIICFYDLYKIETLKNILEENKFKQIRFIEWIKTNPVPINSKINYLTNSREIALTAVKGSKPIFHSSYDNGIYQFPICQDKNRFHPTQKPLGLIEELIKKHSNENDIVLDCFFGSGTTAVACIHTNRQFKGCEIDSIYFEKAKKRIEKERGEKTDEL